MYSGSLINPTAAKNPSRQNVESIFSTNFNHSLRFRLHDFSIKDRTGRAPSPLPVCCRRLPDSSSRRKRRCLTFHRFVQGAVQYATLLIKVPQKAFSCDEILEGERELQGGAMGRINCGYELRIYHVGPGKIENLVARFRDPTMKATTFGGP